MPNRTNAHVIFRFPQKHEFRNILMQDKRLHNFIIITIIVLLEHDTRHLWRVVDEDVRGFGDRSLSAYMPTSDQACINAVASDEKLYDFPSRVNPRGGNPVFCWLSRIPEARLTVKFKGRTPRKI